MAGTEIALASSRASLSEKMNYARALAESGLLPSSFRKQPANVLFAVEYGDMLGLSPMAAIQGIHVIDGKPSASAALMSALVRVKGHKLRVVFDKATTSAYAELTRSDDPDFTFRVDWSLERAVTAQLCTIKDGKAYARDKQGRPTSWEKYTPNMLKWRCISEVCRDGAEECLMGMHYTPEELGAEVDNEGDPIQAVVERVEEAVTAAADATEAAEPTDSPAMDEWADRIKQAEEACDLPALTELWNEASKLPKDQAPPSQWIKDAAARVKEVLRQRQMNHLFALFALGGITSSDEDKPKRLRIAQNLLARDPLTTYAELSDAELAEFITTLTGLKKVGTLAKRLEEFSATPKAELAAVVDQILNARSVEEAVGRLKEVSARDDVGVDVVHLLTQADREALGLREDQPCELLALADSVARYCEKHTSGPRVLPEAA